MLSKAWSRARILLWRGLRREKQEDQMLRNMLIEQYRQLSKQLDTEQSLDDIAQARISDFKSHPFINERVIHQENKNEGLANIFSLQNLKLLGTKEGPELAKLQLQLQKNLDSYFPSSPISAAPSPSQRNIPIQSPNTPIQSSPTQPQSYTSQNTPAHSPHNNTQQLTIEDKLEIARLVDNLTPKPLGFLARMFSCIRRPTSLEDADVFTLHQLVQDKTAELRALKSKQSTTTSPTTLSPAYTTKSTDSTTANAKESIPTRSTDTASMQGVPAHVIEQIKQRKEMRAAGVAPENLPKLDLSGIPADTLKQIHKSYQRNKPTNKNTRKVE